MEYYQKAWLKFVALCENAEDEKKLSSLFDLLLTPQEKEDIAMRYLIIQELLREKETQRDIAKNLNVSIAKITRGSNELKRIPESFLRYLRSRFLAD
jgi:TrpR family trp operon transcriptional repressor